MRVMNTRLMTCVFLAILISITDIFAQNSIKFFTQGQQYGVADLDHLWISATKDKDKCCWFI